MSNLRTSWRLRGLAPAVLAAFGLLVPGGAVRGQAALDGNAVAVRADAWLKAYHAAGDFSGVVLLAQGDKILFEKAYGSSDPQVGTPNRPQTQFRGASLSKTFTAAAIEKLVAGGKLRYADALSRYLSGIPNGDTITIEQLLLHTSGVGVLDSPEIYRECLNHAEILQRIGASKPRFAPGKGDAYSNEGYFLLAAMVERVSGISYNEFLRNEIFVPLQMKNSATACRDLPEGSAFGAVATAAAAKIRPVPFNESALDGAGSVYSNAEDLLRWLRAVDTNPAFAVDKLKYPYGWGKRKYSSYDLIEQSGQLAGFNAHIALYPKQHIYAVVLSNIESGFAQRVPLDLEAVLFGGAVSQPPVVGTEVLGDRSMKQYIGRYHSKETPYTQTLEIHDGQLVMHWGDDPFSRELAMTDGDTFFVRADYGVVHFVRGQDGFVHRMTWNWPGGSHLTLEKDEVTGSPVPTVPDEQ